MLAAVMCSLISLWSRHYHFIDILSSPRSKSNWLLNLRPITVACVRGMPWLLRCRRLQTAVPSSRKNPATAALRACGFHHPWHDTVEHHISQSWRAFQWSGVAEQPEVPWQKRDKRDVRYVWSQIQHTNHHQCLHEHQIVCNAIFHPLWPTVRH